MSELDLGLKVGVRRLLWAMGYSTRLDVQLRGDRRPMKAVDDSRGRPSRGAYETFTDLDVLGVLAVPGFGLSTLIADCKSGTRDKPTARMFWARGVADLFGADQVMLVREHEVNDATRQLSNRLGITVLAAPDLVAMQELHSASAAPERDLGVLFDRVAVAAHLSAFSGLDRRLNDLMEYREFDYWVYDQHRNPMQLVAHLQEAARHLDSRNPTHLALFLDLAWMYTLTLVRVCGHVHKAFLRDPDRGLQEYLFGGATSLHEKKESAALLRAVAPPGVKELTHLPEYYPLLRELTARFMRRPEQMQTSLRYAEVASALMAARRRIALPQVFGEEFRPVAAKLVADVCGFLVSAANVEPGFRVQARAWLLGERVEQAPNPQSEAEPLGLPPSAPESPASDPTASSTEVDEPTKALRGAAASDEAPRTWDQAALPLAGGRGEGTDTPS